VKNQELIEYYKEKITEAKERGADYSRESAQLTKLYKIPKKIKTPKVVSA